MISVSTDSKILRVSEVKSRNKDSGVVIRMSGGVRRMRARSACGVSPVRRARVGTRRSLPRRRAACEMPAMGARKLRSMSTAKALSGETYSTRQRVSLGGSAEFISLSTADKNAARVLPEPVGESSNVDAPEMIAGKPSVWARVGAPSVDSNQSRAGRESSRRGSTVTSRVYALPRRRAVQDPMHGRQHVLEQQRFAEKRDDVLRARHVLAIGGAGEDHGDVPEARIGKHPPAQLAAVHLRHFVVGDHDRDRLRGQLLQGL